MMSLFGPIIWLYEEFGLGALYSTGKDAWIILASRFCRMFAYGSNSLILALFFSSLGFTDEQIGIFMTLTLAGDVLLSLFLTMVADRLGRRRILTFGSLLMVFSGFTFAIFENFWILLFAAVVGVISATGGELGPFRAVEESTLSHLTTPETRASVIAWYVTTATFGSSIGTEIAGHIVEYLQNLEGWTAKDAYHKLFWLYVLTGLVNIGMISMMSGRCEATKVPEAAEESEILLEDVDSEGEQDGVPKLRIRPPVAPKKKKLLVQLSPETKPVAIKLGLLFALDALAGGMTPWSLVNYYIDTKFELPKDQLGHIISIAYFLSAFSAMFAGPLSKRIGLVETMVYTHLPSSVALGLIPAGPNLPITVILLFTRAGLNSLDQAPRTALVAAVLKPEERTAIMGLFSTGRTLAQSIGPTVTGMLAGSKRFWVAFLIASAARVTYDLGLWAMFKNMTLHQHEPEFKSSNHRRQDSGYDEEAGDSNRR